MCLPPKAVEEVAKERRERRERRWCVLDIEARRWSEFACAVTITDTGVVTVFRTRAALSEWVARWDGTVWAHAGGRYDFMFLDRPPSRVSLSGSTIRRAEFGTAVLRDSLLLLLCSLADVGRSVGVEKYEDKSDRTEELSDDELIEHCIQDCRVLHAGIIAHRKWVETLPHRHPWRYPNTAGATAVLAAEALEPDAVDRWAQESPDLDTSMMLLSTVKGGRVEVCHLGRVGPVYVYDRNSSYPASWGPAVPLGEPFWSDRERPNLLGVYRVQVDQSRLRLPVVDCGGWSLCGEAWATTDQLQRLRERGAHVRVLGGWVCPDRHEFGQTIASMLYPQRKTQAGGKVAMNSVHGKFSQQYFFPTYLPIVTADGIRWERTLELTLPDWYQRPLVASIVLARAALALEDVMYRLLCDGWRVFACDTDGVHTDCPPERFAAITGLAGLNLGQWKQEVAGTEGLYIGPKGYAIRVLDASNTDAKRNRYVWDDGSWWKVVCKGIPRHRRTPDLFRQVLRNGDATVECDAGLKTFLSLRGKWGPERAQGRRTVSPQLGGKIPVAGETRLRYALDVNARTA